MRLFIASFLFTFSFLSYVQAQEVLQNSDWKMNISSEGCITQLIFKAHKDTILFSGPKRKNGPRFYTKINGKQTVGKWISKGKFSYETEIKGVQCILTYIDYHRLPSVKIRLTNRSHVPFQPQKAGIRMGIDTYMDKYPEWFEKYFPTLMRCEKTHFYGYFQTPKEHTVALVSEQPIASWSVDFNLGYQDPAPHWFMGHRIESLNLDLLNTLPLPQRHPQNLYELKQNESKEWVVSFINVGQLSHLEETITTSTHIPLIYAKKTSYRPGDLASFEVFGKNPEVNIWNDEGLIIPITSKVNQRDKTIIKVSLPKVGMYTIKVRSENRLAEAILEAHHTWEWVLRKARQATLKFHQKPTSHAESWYGFYSAFIAARYFPETKEDDENKAYFNLLFKKLHDTQKMEPLYYKSRIQNTSTTIGMLVDKYEAFNDVKDLVRASKLGDWVIMHWQKENGAYYNHGIVYTSVIYVAKSMLELSLAEKKAAQKNHSWRKAAARHYASAKKAIDQLVRSQGNFETEGEMTFEDGMISCSALQIGMLALLQEDAVERERYTEAMLKILNSHSCLTQLRVPDARQRQGTMRYWEAQYDVMMLPNMFNSPHGWSAWRAYATYYAYLLTGKERWLMQTFNAMGAFANLIDYKSGVLRWAFVVNPYIEAEQACSVDKKFTFSDLSFGNPHPRLYDTKHFVLGESYVNMISDWQTVNSQDNDVHEVFKCIGETVLTNAFVIERANGDIVGYNCDVKKEGGLLLVTPHEAQITHLHCNLKHNFRVKFRGETRKRKTLGWVF